MSRTYDQPDVNGGSTRVTIVALPEIRVRPRTSPVNAPYRRLIALQDRIIAARDTAGGWDTYFAAGGLATIRGTRRSAPRPVPVETNTSEEALDLDSATKRLRKAEMALFTAQAAYRAAASSSLNPAQIARRAGAQWFASTYRALMRERQEGRDQWSRTPSPNKRPKARSSGSPGRPATARGSRSASSHGRGTRSSGKGSPPAKKRAPVG